MTADTVEAHCRHCDSTKVKRTSYAPKGKTYLGIFLCDNCGQESVIWPGDLR